ncbi:hypothetical protein CRUP_023362 [Coryphaenoides rupestris]|nr:hypothetical protein CRUP_023362 [Coryphaenoides rupestris]
MVRLSKSGAEDASVRKAGHLPAVKAAGKRVPFAENPGTSEKETKRIEKRRSVVTVRGRHQVSLLLTGPLYKVRPAAEKRHAYQTFYIQQPRKGF